MNGTLSQCRQSDLCATSPVPATLQPETWSAIEALGERRWIDRGAVLFRAGDAANNLYVIVTGRVKVILYSRDGEEALGTVLGTGEVLGSVSLLDGRPRGITATADERTEVLMLPRNALESLVATSPTVALDVYRLLIRQLRRSYAFIEDTIFLDVAGRVAKKLLELADEYGEATDGGLLIELPLTQLELATMVGVTRETVNKHLGAYRARGIIDVRDHRILIRQPETLRRRIY
jgi:CRP/FNR family transcriptional regulator/CRP/FNR family cyclic AMP-dependent transcriptional regulator